MEVQSSSGTICSFIWQTRAPASFIGKQPDDHHPSLDHHPGDADSSAVIHIVQLIGHLQMVKFLMVKFHGGDSFALGDKGVYG